MAKKTIGDCLGEVRVLLQDTYTPYRYSDEELIAIFNNALHELKRLRPDLYVGSFGTDITIYTTSDTALEVPFAAIAFQAVVLYITGFAELRDDEFTVDQRAGTLLRAFTGQLTGQGGVI
jgi:hypothetical protein